MEKKSGGASQWTAQSMCRLQMLSWKVSRRDVLSCVDCVCGCKMVCLFPSSQPLMINVHVFCMSQQTPTHYSHHTRARAPLPDEKQYFSVHVFPPSQQTPTPSPPASCLVIMVIEHNFLASRCDQHDAGGECRRLKRMLSCGVGGTDDRVDRKFRVKK